jgi:hypothetical protein
MVGTLQYMSPEQADMGASDIDTLDAAHWL